MKEVLYRILFGLCGFLFVIIALLGAMISDPVSGSEDAVQWGLEYSFCGLCLGVHNRTSGWFRYRNFDIPWIRGGKMSNTGWTLAWLGVLAAVGASVYFIAEVNAPNLFN